MKYCWLLYKKGFKPSQDDTLLCSYSLYSPQERIEYEKNKQGKHPELMDGFWLKKENEETYPFPLAPSRALNLLDNYIIDDSALFQTIKE